MSSLWTPGGEHLVPRTSPRDAEPPSSAAPGGRSPHGGTATGPGRRPSAPDGGAGPSRAADREGAAPEARGQQGQGGDEALSPEEIRQAEQEMAAVREQLANTPAEIVIANHAMGLWELAALHLSQQPPQLPQAQLAIDALGALVDGLRGRLGEPEKILADGLAELRMAFVHITNAERARQSAG